MPIRVFGMSSVAARPTLRCLGSVEEELCTVMLGNPYIVAKRPIAALL